METSSFMDRLRKGENLHTEFKLWPLRPDDLAAAMVAFANTDGGEIFLGVADDGAIRGIAGTDTDSVTQFVDNIAFQNCAPPMGVTQQIIRDVGVDTVIGVSVAKGDERPYRTNRGVYYVRTNSGRRQATRQELLRLFQASESLFHDETPVSRSSQEDLNDDALTEMLGAIQEQGLDLSGIERTRLLYNWGLLRDTNGEARPTMAGALLLADKPQRFTPHAYISALRIPATDISVPPLDQKRIEGRLFDMLTAALGFLDFHLLRRHRIRRLEPEVVLEFPVAALREVLVNALAHRDYTISGPIRLLVFDDRVEVRSPGRLPNSVRVEQLSAGVHVLRNPTLYNMLLKRGLVTDAGSGIPRVIRLLRDKTGREPNFRLDGSEFVVTLKRPDSPMASGD